MPEKEVRRSKYRSRDTAVNKRFNYEKMWIEMHRKSTAAPLDESPSLIYTPHKTGDFHERYGSAILSYDPMVIEGPAFMGLAFRREFEVWPGDDNPIEVIPRPKSKAERAAIVRILTEAVREYEDSEYELPAPSLRAAAKKAKRLVSKGSK